MTKKINSNLTAEQKLILFEEGTELAGSSELNNEKICPTAHSSELSQIFFETLEHKDCFYDPMSIYR